MREQIFPIYLSSPRHYSLVSGLGGPLDTQGPETFKQRIRPCFSSNAVYLDTRNVVSGISASLPED